MTNGLDSITVFKVGIILGVGIIIMGAICASADSIPNQEWRSIAHGLCDLFTQLANFIWKFIQFVNDFFPKR